MAEAPVCVILDMCLSASGEFLQTFEMACQTMQQKLEFFS